MYSYAAKPAGKGGGVGARRGTGTNSVVEGCFSSCEIVVTITNNNI